MDIIQVLTLPRLRFSELRELSSLVRLHDHIEILELTLSTGKTTTTEFTVTNSGPNTTNPHDSSRTLGGSSCGSAAAVADMQVPLSLGAQTGGSIIRPASFSGVFAMKPTHSAISTEGKKAFEPTFDTFDFFANSIGDPRLLADVFALTDDEVPKEVPIEQISVALIKTPFWTSAGPGTIAAMNEAATTLRSCGANVEEVSFPKEVSDAENLKRIQKVITAGEAQATFLREYRVDKNNLAQEICHMVENASNYTRKERVRAYDTYGDMRRIVDDIAKQYSVIITPSAIDEAPLGLGDMGSATFNTLWTVSLV
jgi:Asp-tRNA(Asn)/Glu-tRNA(Gln) amidotransferase A subunit family amidase